MPSAANAKSEKPASSEATDNSPIRQIITIIEHKIRNLEKRKGKLTQYRDLQKAGKELNSDQRVAVAKYDEVAQTLEFARDLSKQVTAIAISAEREAKKQAKKEAWVRYAAETNKIREVLLILDVLMQMGANEVREDFLNGTNGAAKLTEEDLKILDDLYPEVTPKHELNEEGQPGFHSQTTKAAEHLYAIIDGKPKEVLGTTYTRIKEIVVAVHECGYFDRTADGATEPEVETPAEPAPPEPEEEAPPTPAPAPPSVPVPAPAPPVYASGALPVPPAPAVVPAPAYPLRPLAPITLQEVEHAYFAQQYPQRPIAEVIGSQNFFFLQESEIDSPASTPQPPPIAGQPSPPGPIPTQTFTNQHFMQGARVDPAGMPLPPQPHFAPHPDHAAFAAVPLPHPHHVQAPPPPPLAQPQPQPQPAQPTPPQPQPPQVSQPPAPQTQSSNLTEERPVPSPANDKNDDDWKESRSPEDEDGGDRKTQGQGDGQGRFRRYGRGGRGAPNGHRGSRGGFQPRQGDGYRGYQNRANKDGYHPRHYDRYQNRDGKDYPNRDDAYYGNGDTADNHRDHNENGGRERERERYHDGYQGGYKARGRGGARGLRNPAPRAAPSRNNHYNRKQDNAE